jgi:hypothetical protein
MYDPFEDRFTNTIPDDAGRIPPFTPGKIVMGDYGNGELTIPIFMKFFRRSGTPKICSICTDAIYEIAFESEEQWNQVCEGYRGSWMDDVLQFPTKATLGCEHDMDACKACLATHLSTQLEQFGRTACGQLSCPTCNRSLSDDEVRCFGSKETALT